MMQATTVQGNGVQSPPTQLVSEIYAGEVYEYYPLGQYIVAAPGVCGGRPTLKYTRIEVRIILAYLAEGRTIAEIVEDYGRGEVTPEAISEAIWLASQALAKSVAIPETATV